MITLIVLLYMQIAKQSPDLAPSAATRTRPATVTIEQNGGVTTITVPRTREEIGAVIRQREALSDQLYNVSDRRHELSQELQGTVDPVARQGLEDRIRVLDQRILQLETDLGATGRQLSQAPPNLVSTTESGMAPPQNNDDVVYPAAALGAGGMLAACAAVFFFNRRRWKGLGRGLPAGMSEESAQRLQRLEQGMEAIAIEIERISEGQRFVTKLLSQSPVSAPMANNAEPLAIETRAAKT
jgi:hypothetical protein